MSITELSSKERSVLRAAAHALKPTVQVGENNGLTPAVLKEIDLSLTAHGLIKVRVAGDDRENRLMILQAICAELGCVSVAHFGKVLTLFRFAPQHAHLLAGAKPPVERSKRLPNEEYTPKKLAAAGKTIKDKKRKSVAPKANDELVKKPSKPTIPVRSSIRTEERTTARRGAGRTVVSRSTRSASRRTGSALTLRAGRRGR
ncbi:YhbY family RNA-binding protein [Pelistega europaea]|uniref:YhbY family RNA-binding protein n=1 Tax=Pelistega europaea TaxID=106147 RepID=A0A7Y4LAH0_9BURK|nr:YhbY family RNA-binding protein [Pelistega europaea]NOL49883.1 YhbY family RNA-binding protein [Pelistega europaea]